MCTNVKFEIFPALSFIKFETNPTPTHIRNFSIYMDLKQRQLGHLKFFRVAIRNFSALPAIRFRACVEIVGPAVYKNIAEFNEIENSSPYSGKGHTEHEAKSRRCRQFPMIKRLH